LSRKNKALVLEAFDTLFNKRDYAAAEKFWSPHYMQHSAHIAPGREGLFRSHQEPFRQLSNMSPERLWLKGISSSCTDDFRASALPMNWIAADIVRIKDGVSGRALGCDPRRGPHKNNQRAASPMFGDKFATYARCPIKNRYVALFLEDG